MYFNLNGQFNRDSEEFHEKWVLVTTVWSVLKLRMDERPPEWRVIVNILNKQSRKTDKGRTSGFGLCEVLTTSDRKNVKYYESFKKDLGLGLILL
jgi:hypothetical protein